MTDNADNWSRDISAKLDELSDYIDQLAEQLRPEQRVTLPASWGYGNQILANDELVAIHRILFQRNRANGALLVLKQYGRQPLHVKVPVGSRAQLGPSGLLVYDQFVQKSGQWRCVTCDSGAALKAEGSLTEFVKTYMSSCSEPMVSSLQLPGADGLGLLALAETTPEEDAVRRGERLVIFRRSGNGWEIVREKRNPKRGIIHEWHAYQLCTNRLIRHPLNCGEGEWIEYFDRNAFITRGSVIRKYSCQLSEEYSGEFPREEVSGVDSGQVYILDRETGMLERIAVI